MMQKMHSIEIGYTLLFANRTVGIAEQMFETAKYLSTFQSIECHTQSNLKLLFLLKNNISQLSIATQTLMKNAIQCVELGIQGSNTFYHIFLCQRNKIIVHL